MVCRLDSREAEQLTVVSDMLRTFDAQVLVGIGVIGLTMLILSKSLGPNRQTITINVSRAGVPVSKLLVHLKFDAGSDCAANAGSFSRTGLTDAAGRESWTRPVPRKHRDRRGRNFDGLFEAALVPPSPPLESFRICAVVEDAEQVIFSQGQQTRDLRRLDVTCDLALKSAGPCYGVYRLSLDRTLVPYAFLPLCLLLGIAMYRAPDRPMGRDAAGLGVALLLALLTGPLQRFWLVCQILSVASLLAVIVALAHTLAANYRFRASNRG